MIEKHNYSLIELFGIDGKKIHVLCNKLNLFYRNESYNVEWFDVPGTPTRTHLRFWSPTFDLYPKNEIKYFDHHFFSWTTNVLWKRYLMIVGNETSTDTPRAWGGGGLPSEPRYQAMRGLIKMRKNLNESDFFIRPGVGSRGTPKKQESKKINQKKRPQIFFRSLVRPSPPGGGSDRQKKPGPNPWILSANIHLCKNEWT